MELTTLFLIAMGTGDNENGTYELSYCQLASTASHFKEYK
jgi:hypothetical protein